MSLFRRIERRATTLAGSKTAWDVNVETPALPTGSGVNITPDRARTLVAVWSCQSLIADGVASLPIDTYRKIQSRGRRERVDNPRWLDNPNPFETPYVFWHKVMISLLGEDGNAFIHLVRDQGRPQGTIISAFVLNPALVEIDEESPAPLFRMGDQTFTENEILHIPAFVKPGQRRGLSIIAHAAETIGLGLAAEEFGARFFSQGTTLSGIVEHPKTPSPGEVAVMARMLRKGYAGVKNSHAVGILTGGATWKSISITPEQAQFLETRRFQNVQIAQLYRVPPHLIDPTVTSSWGSGVEEQNKFFVDYTLVPWLTRLEQAVSRVLPANQYIKFNVDARLRAKTVERFQAYVQAVNNGIMSLDEVRALEDMEPIPDGMGRAHVRPLNVAELGKQPSGDGAPGDESLPVGREGEDDTGD